MLGVISRALAGRERLPLDMSGLETRSVFVLGMHRSGTSCLAGILGECGLELGEVGTDNKYNRKGNRELKEVQSINNDLLALNGGDWQKPEKAVVTDAATTNRIRKVYAELGGTGRLWGIKDPRMLFCLDAWKNPLSAFVGTFRHPNSVAASLLARGHTGMTRAFALELWHKHNVELVRLYTEERFPIVDFDWEPERYCHAVRLIAEQLGLDGKGVAFFDDDLRHNRDCGSINDARLRALYDELLEIAATEEKRLRSAG